MRVPKQEPEQSNVPDQVEKRLNLKSVGNRERTTSITVPISTKKDSIKIRKGAKRHSIVV